MIKITARRLGNFVPLFVVELEGDEKTLTNILEKLKMYRTLDKDLKEINPQDIKPALDVLSGR